MNQGATRVVVKISSTAKEVSTDLGLASTYVYRSAIRALKKLDLLVKAALIDLCATPADEATMFTQDLCIGSNFTVTMVCIIHGMYKEKCR